MWISCRIRSESHVLNEEAFRLLQRPEINIRARNIRQRDFEIAVRSLEDADSEPAQLHHAHHVINALLVALNVATIGGFYWFVDPWVHPVLSIAEDLDASPARESALIVQPGTAPDELRDLSEGSIRDTVLIFGIVAREQSDTLVGEYCRGLLLLRMNFYQFNFRREAFLCFYRALEHFVATRILGLERLRNELRDLQRGLGEVGASDELQQELREVYQIRSSQIAHSQAPQREITVDEVLKTKVFLDFVMHKTFMRQANEIMEKNSQGGSQ